MAGRGRGRWLGDGTKTDPPVTESAGGATGYFELHPDTLGYVLGLGENLRRYYYYYYYYPRTHTHGWPTYSGSALSSTYNIR